MVYMIFNYTKAMGYAAGKNCQRLFCDDDAVLPVPDVAVADPALAAAQGRSLWSGFG